MPILVISDIHANLAALEAVLNAAGKVDEVWCLGDIIGYGPNPNECVERVAALNSLALIGNHDLASLGALDLTLFNPLARQASEWTSQQLTAESRQYLAALPPMRRVNDQVTIAHGSPREPVWEYLLETDAADQSMLYFDTQLCLVGHTHVPMVFQTIGDQSCMRRVPYTGEQLILEQHSRYIINPGSVGQPRDGDPQAAYAILDLQRPSLTFQRVPYDVARTQQLMKAAGLPELLSARLSLGM